jgi:dTDP-4-amino-4,6-dideoxygalactose transaminase
MFRHLPPAATPLTFVQWRAGWMAPRPDHPPFREQLAAYLRAPAGYTAASGRAALYTLLKAIRCYRDRPERQEVVLPAYTCPALVQVILDLDLLPVLVDVLPETMDFRPDELLAHLHRRTLAVIYVHPFGLPQPVYQVLDAAHAVGAVVIEDAAQALGAGLRGRPVGTWGDFGLFSLGPGKAMSVGGGGVVCANHEFQLPVLTAAWKALPQPGWAASFLAQWRLAALSLAFRPAGWWLANRVGARRFGNSEIGRGYRVRGLSTAQERVAGALFPLLADINDIRQANAQRLLRGISGSRQVRPVQLTAGAAPMYLRLPLLARDKNGRDRLVAELNQAGIGAGKMYGQALPGLFPDETWPSCPGAEALAGRLLTLPTHHYLTGRDIELITTILQ